MKKLILMIVTIFMSNLAVGSQMPDSIDMAIYSIQSKAYVKVTLESPQEDSECNSVPIRGKYLHASDTEIKMPVNELIKVESPDTEILISADSFFGSNGFCRFRLLVLNEKYDEILPNDTSASTSSARISSLTVMGKNKIII